MTPTTSSDLALLYQALASPIGIVVHSTNPQAAKGRLYAARKLDPQLAQLQFRTPATNPESELWIVREHVQLAGRKEEEGGGA